MNEIEYLKKYGHPDTFTSDIEKLKQGIPVQYIIGNVDFYKSNFIVNENTLIPRFETEELVDRTIKYARKFNHKIKILDIGTGTGCIAISLKKELNASVTASDISKKALEVARKNAILNKVDINFILSDVFSNIKDKYHIIISNPPYIAYDEEIMDIVKNNEPHLALFASDNGLYFYKKILDEVSNYLEDEYLIAFEIGYKQGESIKEYAMKSLPKAKVWVEKDLSDKDRYIFITNKSII